MRIFFLFVLLFSKLLTIAQTNTLDSLLIAIEQTNDEIEKIDLLNKISLKYIEERFNADKAFEYAQLALDLSVKQNYKEGIACANRRIAFIYGYKNMWNTSDTFRQRAMVLYKELKDKSGEIWCLRHEGVKEKVHGNYEKALGIFNRAVQFAAETDNEYELYWGYYNLADIYRTLGNYSESLENIQSALDVKQKMSDQRGIAECYNLFGMTYYLMGDYAKSIENYHLALRIAEKLGDKSEMSWVYNNIGAIYYYQAKYDLALEYYQKALDLKKEINDEFGMANTYNNFGEIFQLRENFQEALRYYFLSLEISEKRGEKRLNTLLYLNIGDVYKSQKNDVESTEYYTKALKVATEIEYNEMIARSNWSLAAIYSEKAQLKNALRYATMAYDIASSTGNLEARKKSSEILSKVYLQNKSYHKALKYYKVYTSLKDSLFTTEKNKQLSELEIKYQVEKKDQEIHHLNSEVLFHKKLKNLGILVLLLTIALFLVSYKRIKLKTLLLEKENELEKERANQFKLKLASKNRELLSQSLVSAQKNQTLNELKEQLLQSEDKTPLSEKALKLVDESYSIDKDWENLKIHFEKVHTDFFSQLQNQFPELTPNDLRHCAYIKIQMSTKDVARIMNVDPKSVKMTRYRLKKKFGLDAANSLESLMNEI